MLHVVSTCHSFRTQEGERERNEEKHRSQKVRDRRKIEQREAEMKVVKVPLEALDQHPDDGT